MTKFEKKSEVLLFYLGMYRNSLPDLVMPDSSSFRKSGSGSGIFLPDFYGI
jgi:hypothetical protein